MAATARGFVTPLRTGRVSGGDRSASATRHTTRCSAATPPPSSTAHRARCRRRCCSVTRTPPATEGRRMAEAKARAEVKAEAEAAAEAEAEVEVEAEAEGGAKVRTEHGTETEAEAGAGCATGRWPSSMGRPAPLTAPRLRPRWDRTHRPSESTDSILYSAHDSARRAAVRGTLRDLSCETRSSPLGPRSGPSRGFDNLDHPARDKAQKRREISISILFTGIL